MMSGLFDDTEATDPDFAVYATSDWPRAKEGRAFIEALYRDTSPYLDPGLQQRCRHALQQAFWEMYLCAAFLDLGLPVCRRAERRAANRGPDLQIGSVLAWCEATAVVAGDGDDRVPEAPLGVASRVPHDLIKLRLLQAISKKDRKGAKYFADQLIQVDEPFVVAVNASKVPSARLELDIPRIVATLFPIGWPTATLDVETGALISTGHAYQGTVAKVSGARVPTDGFLSGGYRHVSAVLYSACDPLNRPSRLGDDLICVHNPTALTSLPMGFFARGQEYWLAGDKIDSRRHE